jgi:hypothetical protein
VAALLPRHGAASDMESSLECIEQAAEDCRQGVVFQICGWGGGLTTHRYEMLGRTLLDTVMSLHVP